MTLKQVASSNCPTTCTLPPQDCSNIFSSKHRLRQQDHQLLIRTLSSSLRHISHSIPAAASTRRITATRISIFIGVSSRIATTTTTEGITADNNSSISSNSSTAKATKATSAAALPLTALPLLVFLRRESAAVTFIRVIKKVLDSDNSGSCLLF